MDALDIRFALLRKGCSAASIAREVGVSRAMVSSVIHAKNTSRRVMAKIAAVLEMDPSTVFPWASRLFNSPDMPQQPNKAN